MSGWTNPCPRCGKVGTYHLMMMECDDCINRAGKSPEPYIERNGILVPNESPDSAWQPRPPEATAI